MGQKNNPPFSSERRVNLVLLFFNLERAVAERC